MYRAGQNRALSSHFIVRLRALCFCSNALKFSRQDGSRQTVDIKVSLNPDTAGGSSPCEQKSDCLLPSDAANASQRPSSVRLLFSVTDHGVGISADGVTKLFSPFTQLEESNQLISARGTGLGLVISQSFVNLMGGRSVSNATFV